eukprot:CAMPEP_0196582412 /NCGR_PEP_ID=MMETSP1081-20130531/38820_1 /TAXON_ID=36882 /ORGANISM="Pyramimonas amylifera, Strain CCMP720" /LENGTH=376 /DNA_ID=CAMNT_0041902963 /DNA_START=176 /DNA_END=1306 /DNA_ORIENTATION=-
MAFSSTCVYGSAALTAKLGSHQQSRLRSSKTPGLRRSFARQHAHRTLNIVSPPYEERQAEGKTDAAPHKKSELVEGLFGNKSEGLNLSFGFPKGSLQKSTEDLFHRAGYTIKFSSDRNYFPSIDDKDLNLVLFRSQEIPRYVEDGILDVGICGHDWVVETGADVVEVCELKYSKATSNPARWVVAVPESSPIQSIQDFSGSIIASELVSTTRKYFEDNGVENVKVEFSWGATEVKARLPRVAGIVDITETGSSLVANKLRIVDTILASTTRMVANRDAWEDPEKRLKIENIAMLLQGAIHGRSKKGLKMNIKKEHVATICDWLPAEQSPTISPLVDTEYCALEVVVEESMARDLVVMCKRLGAHGIFSYPVDILVD